MAPTTLVSALRAWRAEKTLSHAVVHDALQVLAAVAVVEAAVAAVVPVARAASAEDPTLPSTPFETVRTATSSALSSPPDLRAAVSTQILPHSPRRCAYLRSAVTLHLTVLCCFQVVAEALAVKVLLEDLAVQVVR